MDSNTYEGSLDEFVETVFRMQPQPPKSIQFTAFNIDQTEQGFTTQDLFELVLELWTKGMKILYANTNGIIDLDQLSYEDAEHIRKYLQSMGLDMYWGKIIEQEGMPEPIVVGHWPPPQANQDSLHQHILRLQTPNAMYHFAFELI